MAANRSKECALPVVDDGANDSYVDVQSLGVSAAGVRAFAADFIAAGLRAGDGVLILATSQHGHEMASILASSGVSWASFLASGQLCFTDLDELIARHGPAWVRHGRVDESVAAALISLRSSYSRMRVYGYVANLACDEGVQQLSADIKTVIEDLRRQNVCPRMLWVDAPKLATLATGEAMLIRQESAKMLHDFNNPLSILLSCVSRLERLLVQQEQGVPMDWDRLHKTVESLKLAGTRMHGISQDFANVLRQNKND